MNAPECTLTPASEALAKAAVAAIVSHERESPNSENEPGGNEARLREAIKDVLRGPSPFYSGRNQPSERSAAAARQIEALAKVAVSLDLGEEIGRGGEHVVFRRKGDRDVQKLTLPEVYGYGYVVDAGDGLVWLRHAIASEYLGRLGLMDAVFGVPVYVTGILNNPYGYPQIATRQPWIDGTIPAPAEVSDWLHEQGFLSVDRSVHDRGTIPAGSVWYRPADNVLMGDAVPRNFIKTPDGIIAPIDVSLTLLPRLLLPKGAVAGHGE
jgi:hypothetical protein